MVFCSRPDEVVGGNCSGNGCCESSIPQDINYYKTQVDSLRNSGNMTDTSSFAPCTYAFVGEENVFKFNGLNDLTARDVNDTSFFDWIESHVPIVLDWAIGNQSCAQANKTNDFACQANSTCVDSTREAGGYRCGCKEGYEGNPYLSPGCLGTIDHLSPKFYINDIFYEFIYIILLG
ncbi:hypothetical protein HanXRQr2_Chr10g0430391 [Helianthus annuus]|uniref:EGF-like domain-containing protein n=1 Tax=Helianthus annuus TaxID=4232 RepID=A0A9K3HW20_HELAN|nr:hypothetical protein HanXRQr2_Chr10g0430391 [Helianthus annuus]KAJ0513130.1 hypothetical protein HanHA300_Chr10g0353931 [Helianthus annuus]KAJ0529252.1 hypothetical protein HanHA89_Chr10g0375611 [Helianthus annuus]KAJ0696134.1 hypothetical protein HanLR1_Chr10g0353461 [Helianthus annuus]